MAGTLKNDLTGERFGRLTVVERVHHERRKPHWLCRCDCGNTRVARADAFARSANPSCEQKGPCYRSYKHGHSFSPTYKSWRSMMLRCYRANNENYQWYGARGIAVCKRWHTFKHFLADLGERPRGKTLDRINNNKGYSKANCRWATAVEQRHNRSDAA